MSDTNIIQNSNVQSYIFNIRGEQVIIDKDLANLYKTETRILKQSVKRNIERFPSDFMFELNDNDINLMVSQNLIPSKSYFGGAKPFAFTEHGVSMLSSIMKTDIAIKVNIQIIRAFIYMKNNFLKNNLLEKRIENIEKKQFEFSDNFKKLFSRLEKKKSIDQGIFYNGQIFDSYVFISKLIKKADKKIVLIDNYIDESVLQLLSKRKKGVKIKIITNQNISNNLKQDITKYKQQYGKLEIKETSIFHDRFLVIDEKQTYHIGASLKDLGKKVFAFSLLNINSTEIIKIQ